MVILVIYASQKGKGLSIIEEKNENQKAHISNLYMDAILLGTHW